MANIPKIEIRQKGILTEIYIDGMRLNGVRGFSISQKGGQQPTLTLDLLACDMTIDTACIPALPDVFKTSSVNSFDVLYLGGIGSHK